MQNGHSKDLAVAEPAFVPKTILVTGGAGFIASHVVIRLVKLYPQYKVWGGCGGGVDLRLRGC